MISLSRWLLVVALLTSATSVRAEQPESAAPKRTHHARRSNLGGRSLGLLFLLPFAAFGVVGEPSEEKAAAPAQPADKDEKNVKSPTVRRKVAL